MGKYTGCENANISRVKRYLKENYKVKDGNTYRTPTDVEISDACQKHMEEIETAIRVNSYAYYPGDKIAAAMDWEDDTSDEDIPEEDDEIVDDREHML
jgi:hypothetical protein